MNVALVCFDSRPLWILVSHLPDIRWMQRLERAAKLIILRKDKTCAGCRSLCKKGDAVLRTIQKVNDDFLDQHTYCSQCYEKEKS